MGGDQPAVEEPYLTELDAVLRERLRGIFDTLGECSVSIDQLVPYAADRLEVGKRELLREYPKMRECWPRRLNLLICMENFIRELDRIAKVRFSGLSHERGSQKAATEIQKAPLRFTLFLKTHAYEFPYGKKSWNLPDRARVGEAAINELYRFAGYILVSETYISSTWKFLTPEGIDLFLKILRKIEDDRMNSRYIEFANQVDEYRLDKVDLLKIFGLSGIIRRETRELGRYIELLPLEWALSLNMLFGVLEGNGELNQDFLKTLILNFVSKYLFRQLFENGVVLEAGVVSAIASDGLPVWPPCLWTIEGGNLSIAGQQEIDFAFILPSRHEISISLLPLDAESIYGTILVLGDVTIEIDPANLKRKATNLASIAEVIAQETDLCVVPLVVARKKCKVEDASKNGVVVACLDEFGIKSERYRMYREILRSAKSTTLHS